MLKPDSSLIVPLFLFVCFTLLCPPAPVRAGEGHRLLLLWTANEEEDLRGYRIYECDGSGYLENLVDELLVKDIPRKAKTRKLAAFRLKDLPPGDYCWAVTAFDHAMNESGPSLPACISLGTQEPSIPMADFHEDGFYGSYEGAEKRYDESVVYTFDGKPGELLLAFRVWDVTTPTEVEIFMNGVSLGYAAMTGDYAASLLQTIRIPPECLDAFGPNTLSFKWNPAGPSDVWAVGAVEVLELIPLPAPEFYGNLTSLPSGDTSHPRSVGFMFEGRPGEALLQYQVYDVDREGEVGIFLNGEQLGTASYTGNNIFAEGAPLPLPDDLVLDQGVNTIVFKNVGNPPAALKWGVGAVQVSY